MNKLILLVLVMLSTASCMTWKQVEPEAVALAKTIYKDVAPVSPVYLSNGSAGEYRAGVVSMQAIYFILGSNPILTFVHEQTHHYQRTVLNRQYNNEIYTADTFALIRNSQLGMEQEAELVTSFIAMTKYGYDNYAGYDRFYIPYMVKYMEKWMGFTFSK
jgi:NADH:ubiquinone oxidoreductase subunit 5 (subunit L)/multisubunit Na+/H+ antiporter MnhA subunit